jgi:uncharacterized protein (DUF302 family)
MKIWRLIVMLMVLAVPQIGQAADGLISALSPYSPAQTMDRLASAIQARGLTVFARIDHAAGAASIGQSLRPTAVLIFGNPQGGTPFMQCAQTVGIDLPLKMLVWEDAQGRVWIGYNDPGYLARRHGVSLCPVVAPMRRALAGLVAAAVAP